MCHSTERSLGTATLRAPCSFNDQTPHASHELCPSPPCCASIDAEDTPPKTRRSYNTSFSSYSGDYSIGQSSLWPDTLFPKLELGQRLKQTS